MNCNSNPRDMAYKRNYRCLAKQMNAVAMLSKCSLLCCLLFLTLHISATTAFVGATPALLHKPSSTLSSTTRLFFQQSNTKNSNNNSHNNEKKESTSISVSASTLMPGDVLLGNPSSTPNKLKQGVDFVAARAPGVALSVALAHVALSVSKTPFGTHVSPLLWATILGMTYGNLLHQPEAKKSLATGIKFSKGRLLRLGIILYGFKITLQQIAGIGLSGFATDAVMVTSTLALGMTLGNKLGLDRATSTLIGSGAAICGCSAVLATQPIVGGESHQVSAAVGTVTIFGTLSMFLYPYLFKAVPFLAAAPKLMGIYTGSSLHEIAGVVAAGNAMGGEVALTAVITKLARVLMLAPVLTTLSWMQNRRCVREATENGVPPSKCKIVLPWFAFGFVAVSAINSVVSFPAAAVKMASKASAFSLLCAMAALGVDSDFKAIRKLGSKPLILAGTLWTWLVLGGFTVARLFVGA